jgi:hypothetical protein
MQWFAQLFFCVFVLFAMNFEYIDIFPIISKTISRKSTIFLVKIIRYGKGINKD